MRIDFFLKIKLMNPNKEKSEMKVAQLETDFQTPADYK